MNSAPLARRVAEVRAFNRLYTGVIGVLGEGLVGTSYTLSEARVLFELAQRDLTEVTDLRRELDLDAGFASRLLGKLERKGLVVRERSADDARRQVVHLTPDGRQAQNALEERTVAQVGTLLSRLTEEEQDKLLDSMRTISGLVGDRKRPADLVLRPPRAGDLGWVVHRHGVLYAAEYGLDATFEGLVAAVTAEFANADEPRRQAGWIAELDGERAGSVFCMPGTEPGVALLRLLLVEPRARGHGVGRRLVAECIAFARANGYRRLQLWTIDVLVSARRIYEQAGFELVSEQPERRFGQDVVGQTWQLDLDDQRPMP
jgi:DNA-binding MarR family transcriptional regulator/GNAT superfamily N-acetyltransferase